ncbi:MAG TPA: methyltransferase domain-containing protein [bacterium]|nr:methyltransferase domain-containing protein [bacterium]
MALAPFDRTPPTVARAMLKLAGLRQGERLLDVGCGDGVIVAEAAKLGAVAVGVDIEGRLVRQAWERCAKLGLLSRVHLVVGDYKAVKSWEFNVITLYLTTRGNIAVLEDILSQPSPTGQLRIVTHDFGLPMLEPVRVREFGYRRFDRRTLYLYTI